MSFEHIRKLHHVLFFGAFERGVSLLSNYIMDIKRILDNYKQEVASKKRKEMSMKVELIH